MESLFFQPSLIRAVPTKIFSLFSPKAYTWLGSPLRYGEVEKPEIPAPEWVRLRTRLGGICGSDLAPITLKGSLDNPIQSFVSFPMFLGHEIVGEVEAVGAGAADVRQGDRVAVYPILSCVPRGISPPCLPCRKGEYHLCRSFALGSLPPGQCIGMNSRTGGGFSEYLVAHRSQLFPVPDTVSDEHAVLLDPFCVGLHAVLQADLGPGDRVLVVGAGIIGLSVIQMIRALRPDVSIFAVARHPFQKKLARACGAHRVLSGNETDEEGALLAEELDARQFASRFVMPFFMGGFDVTFDCVGSAETLQRSVHWSNQKGRIILVGSSPSKRFEWSLLYWKEVRLVGSISYAMETLGGERKHAFQWVLELILEKRILPELLPVSTFRLSDYREAIGGLLNKGDAGIVKAAFDFRPSPEREPEEETGGP